MRTRKATLRSPRTLPTDAENILGSPGGLAASLRIAVGMYGQRKRGRLLVEAFERDGLPAPPDAESWMVSEDAPGRLRARALGRVRDEHLAQRQNPAASHEQIHRALGRAGDQ
jgi:hypothetical protein